MRGLYHARGNWIQDGKLQALDLDDIRSMLDETKPVPVLSPFPLPAFANSPSDFGRDF